jgi:hypothetical protein
LRRICLQLPCSLWQRGWKNPYSERCNLHLWTFHKMDLAPGFGCDTLIVSLRDILFLLHLITGQVTDSMKLVFLVLCGSTTWWCSIF